MSDDKPADTITPASAIRDITEIFHRLNRIIPENQEVFKLSPEIKASVALQQLAGRGYSQAPVVAGRHVLGLFGSIRQIRQENTLDSVPPSRHFRCDTGR